MPVCPYCGITITELLEYSPAECKSVRGPDGLDFIEYYETCGPHDWECTQCCNKLFDERTDKDAADKVAAWLAEAAKELNTPVAIRGD